MELEKSKTPHLTLTGRKCPAVLAPGITLGIALHLSIMLVTIDRYDSPGSELRSCVVPIGDCREVTLPAGVPDTLLEGSRSGSASHTCNRLSRDVVTRVTPDRDDCSNGDQVARRVDDVPVGQVFLQLRFGTRVR